VAADDEVGLVLVQQPLQLLPAPHTQCNSHAKQNPTFSEDATLSMRGQQGVHGPRCWLGWLESRHALKGSDGPLLRDSTKTQGSAQ
jgi:hypothetical protein